MEVLERLIILLLPRLVVVSRLLARALTLSERHTTRPQLASLIPLLLPILLNKCTPIRMPNLSPLSIRFELSIVWNPQPHVLSLPAARAPFLTPAYLFLPSEHRHPMFDEVEESRANAILRSISELEVIPLLL